MMSQDYVGNNNVCSKEIDINNVAWINSTEGQYAEVGNNVATQKTQKSSLDSYTQDDINRFSTSPDNLINNVNGDVDSFINEYYDSETKRGKKMPVGSKIKKMFFGRINNKVSTILNNLLADSKYEGKYNTEGTNVVMSSNNIHHIFNEHGNEYRKGQIDVTPENLSKYDEVVGNPDYVGLSSQASRGNTPTFLFTKKINGYSVALKF